MQPKELFETARAAADAAARAHNAALPPEQSRGLDCGFAWVVIKPARGPFVKWLKENDKGRVRDYGGGGIEIWYSKMHDVPTQSVGVHVAAARAFAEILKANGVAASVGSRLD